MISFRVFVLVFVSVVCGELFEGDIELTPEQEVGLYDTGNQYAAGLKTTLWPITIPYHIDESIAKYPTIVQGINDAITELETKTCLRFVKRTNETGYLNLKYTDKTKPCHSPIGYVSIYARSISLNHNCRTKGLILHQFMHVLGFMHEHNRHDRNAFVKVLWDNIPKGNRKKFSRYAEFSTMSRYYNIPYDYSSIMHPSRFWMGNRTVTLVTTDYYKRYKIGQRKELSELDALAINLIYRCPGATRPPMTIPPAPTDGPEPEVKPYVQTKIVCGLHQDYIRCPFKQQLWIEAAMYGRTDKTTCGHLRAKDTNCTAPGVFEKVKAKCNGNIECRLQAYEREFGEPCRGTGKYLKVEYRCVNEDILCNKAGKTISCPSGQVLKVLDAMYGRQSKYICPNIYAKNFNCKADTSLSTTKKLCDGKESCKIFSWDKIYGGNPCPGSVKYLQVLHQCMLLED